MSTSLVVRDVAAFTTAMIWDNVGFTSKCMPGRECYHCHQLVQKDEKHDCWTTTEQSLTAELSEDLMDAWERLRETAGEFGEQRIYASHHSIMFSRKACYFFVRPKRSALEVVIFLGRMVKSPAVRRAMPASRAKIANVVHVTHRDQVEAPITDWLLEAYESSDTLSGKAARRPKVASRGKPTRKKKVPRRAT